MDWRNIVARASWTFVETAISTFVGIEIVFDVDTLISAVVASAVAGGSAVLSFIKTLAQEQLAALHVGQHEA